jgi:hypothetical protein
MKIAVIFHHNPNIDHPEGYGMCRRAAQNYDVQTFIFPDEVQSFVNSLYEKGYDEVQVMDRRIINANAMHLIKGQVEHLPSPKIYVSVGREFGLPSSDAHILVERLCSAGLKASTLFAEGA